MTTKDVQEFTIRTNLASYKKNELIDIAKKLNINDITQKMTKIQLCETLKQFLNKQKKIEIWNNYMEDILSFQGYKKNIPIMLYNKINKIDNNDIKLLKNIHVLRWIFYNTCSSIGNTQGNNLQEKENKFFSKLLHKLKFESISFSAANSYNKTGIIPQWTTIFGQELVFEYLTIEGFDNIQRNFKIDNNDINTKHIIDLATTNNLYEVKTSTFYTTGTANEKIFGVPWKYSDACRLSGKQHLYIVCVGEAEMYSQKWKLINNDINNISPEKVKLKKFFENELNISFVGLQSLLAKLLLY